MIRKIANIQTVAFLWFSRVFSYIVITCI